MPRAGGPATLALSLSLLLTAAGAGHPRALLRGQATVADNAFSTSSCFDATFGSRQAGTATSTGSGTVTVSITAVDPSKAFLVFTTRHASGRPPGAAVRGQLASSTSLAFTRVTDETATVDIQWYVIEYACGVRVQRGSTNQDATTKNVTLPSAVKAVDQAFVLASKTVQNTDSTYSQDDPVIVDLLDAGTLQVRTDRANKNHIGQQEPHHRMAGGRVPQRR